MNDIHHEHICCRLLLAFGDSLELKAMLGKSLSAYMRELSCTMGAVLLKQHGNEGVSSYALAYAIPRNFGRNQSFSTLIEELVGGDAEYEEVHRTTDHGNFYIFPLSDVGILVLKSQERFDEHLMKDLRIINQKFGSACRFCLENSTLKENSQRFMEMADMLPGIVLECTKDFRITFFNRRTQEIFRQIESNQFIPQLLFDFLPREEHRKVQKLIDLLDLGEPMASSDILMKNSRGELFRVNLHLSSIQKSDHITGYRGIAIDVSERAKLEENLITRDKLLHAITVSTQELLKSKQLSASIPYGLKLLGEALEVDRVYYFQNKLNDLGTPVTVSQRGEWSKESVIPQIDNPDLQDVPAELVGLFLEPLQTRKPFKAFIEDLEESVTKELLDSQGIISILVLPIFVQELFWGFVGFDDCTRRREWSDVEQDLLQLFSISISKAIERENNEERIRTLYKELMDDLDTAQSIQRFILPPWCIAEPGLTGGFFNYPSEKVGGDLFDCLFIGQNSYVLYTADISGHGIQAALSMTAVKSIISMIVTNSDDAAYPDKMVTRINRYLSEHLFGENYMTMCYCYVDLNAMTMSCLHAGHPPAAVVSSNGTVKLLDAAGEIPLGWVKDYLYKDSAVIHQQVSEDQIICLYTDGVYDCTNARGTQLGMENFYQMLSDHAAGFHAVSLPYQCFQDIYNLGYQGIADDFSLVSFQMQSPAKQNQLAFRATVADINRMESLTTAAEAFLLGHGVGDDSVLKAKVVMNEFIVNAFLHGIGASYGVPVFVEIQVSEMLTLVFWDRGKQWDFPDKIEEIDHYFDTLNEQSKQSGRGMPMIYAMTSSQSRRRVHELNETRFTITLN